jgi:hypothetical protein
MSQGDLMPASRLPADAVLIVRLAGECLRNEYTDASVAFSVQIDDQAIDLDLRNDVAMATAASESYPLALIEIPPGGAGKKQGRELKFHGSLPPSLSGAMTFKIPLFRLREEHAIEQVRTLDFDEEWRRVGKYWKGQNWGSRPGCSMLPISWQ